MSALADLEARVNALGANQRDQGERLGRVETRLGDVESRLTSVESKLDDTNTRVRSLEDTTSEIKELLIQALDR